MPSLSTVPPSPAGLAPARTPLVRAALPDEDDGLGFDDEELDPLEEDEMDDELLDDEDEADDEDDLFDDEDGDETDDEDDLFDDEDDLDDEDEDLR